MSEELIQFPTVVEIKEMLADARQDIEAELQENPDLVDLSKLIFSVIDVLEEKISKHKDLNKLNQKEKIDIASHISFLNSLEDDFFFTDDELEGFEFEEVELDDEPNSKKEKEVIFRVYSNPPPFRSLRGCQ